MASEKVVAGGETKDKVDEVTDIKFESEDDDDGNGMLTHHASEILVTDVDEEIEMFLKQEFISEQDVSEDGVTQKRNTNEKICNVTDTCNGNVAGHVSECRVTMQRVDGPSEIKHSVQIENNVPEKRNDQTEIHHKKRLRDSGVEDEKEIDYGLGIIVESGTISLESTEHSDNVPGSKNKTDQNAFDVKAKDVGAEAKSMETTSGRTCLINRDLIPLWDSYILAVKGIAPKESGRLKQVLNDVLGSNRHRVRPRQKGDKIVYLHFITLEDMRLAKETLTTQGVANYKLTVTVDSADKRDRKPEDGNEGPASKKMKHLPVVQFYEEDYDKQIEFKVKDITARLQNLPKDILKVYPTYCRLIHHRRLQHDGAICAVDKLKDCPASKRVASSCWFAVGASEETGQLALGIYQGSGHVRKLSALKHNYPDHVVKAAEVFEQFVLAEESRRICRKLLIYTNHVQDLMLLVFVHDTSHVKQVSDEMKQFFMSGDGAKCKVMSVHIKVMKSSNHHSKDADMQLAFGVPSLHDTVAGLQLQLPPVKSLWSTIHGAEMLCQAVEELLVPSKETTVLDIGCGIGLLGLYLSKKAGEVLGVDTSVAVDVATKNATLNGITRCSYFAGDAEVMIPELAKKIKYNSVRTVVTCCINNSYKSGKAMEELRKIQHLDRLVLVEDRTMSCSAILSLNKPSSDKKMGNPFFPSKMVPVDCLPNSKGYVLLVLLERVSSDDMRKFGIDCKSVAAESELRTRGSASRKPYERESRLRLKQADRRWLPNSVWDRGTFSQQRYDAGAGALQNCLLQNTASYEHFQTADVLRACVGAVNSVANVASEYELRRHMEEDYRRQMIEEEHRQWLAKEEERRLMEEMHLRQVQEEDWFRWVHNEQMNRIREEEHRKIEEEEWRRRIEEEEQMRQIQEERMRELQEEEEERMRRIQEERMREIKEQERMRRIQEERMRQIQEEEERTRRIQEERMREIQAEEEQMRQVQEERMRQMQEEEEERMRRIQEERMREIQAEEERKRQVQEERMRQIQEEERMRRMREIQEEERMRQIQEERMKEMQAEEERMRQVQEERMRQIQEEERMRWMREIQEEEQMRRIQEERMRQVHEVDRMRQIQEEEYRRNEEEEWRRQVSEAEWRRQMKGEQRRIKEEEWRRQIQEDEQRKQIQKEEQRKIKEEEWRRKMQRESQKRHVLEEKYSEKVLEEEQLRRPVKEERERELVRGSVVSSRKDLVQDLIAAAIPQLSADAAQKVKHLVAEAIRTVGAMKQGERPGGGQNREVGGFSREDNTVSRYGTSDKEMSRSRHMEEEYLRYIREVESARDHSHDTSGGAVGRCGSEQNDLKAPHQAVGVKSTEKLPSLLDLKLKHPEFKVESSHSAVLHSVHRGGDTDQWQRKVAIVGKEFDSQAERDRPTDRSFIRGNRARDLVRRDEKPTFSSVTENPADIYFRRSDLDLEKQRSSVR